MELIDLLPRIHSGDREALNAAIPILYSDLKRLAANHLRREVTCSIEPSDLVHDTYLKMSGLRHPNYQSRAHFSRHCIEPDAANSGGQGKVPIGG